MRLCDASADVLEGGCGEDPDAHVELGFVEGHVAGVEAGRAACAHAEVGGADVRAFLLEEVEVLAATAAVAGEAFVAEDLADRAGEFGDEVLVVDGGRDDDAGEDDFGGCAVGSGGARGGHADLLEEFVHQFVRLGADVELEGCGVGDDVDGSGAGLDARHLAGPHLGGVALDGGDGLRDGGGHFGAVDAEVRARGVGRAAVDHDVGEGARGVANGGGAGARRDVLDRTHVAAQGDVDVVDGAGLQDLERAVERLLARLEEDLEGAAAHAARELGGGGEHHRAVAVVAAGVDGLDRAVIVPEGQGVHVGSKHQDGAVLGAPDDAHDARLPDAARDGVAELFEGLGKVGGGLVFFKTEFGRLVQVAPDLDDVECHAGLQCEADGLVG